MLFALLLSHLLAFNAHAATALQTPQGVVLVEKYQEEGRWFVDEFVVLPGKLQERRSHRGFDFEFQATDYVHRVKKTGNILKSAPKVTVREAKAVAIWQVKNAWSAEWENRYAQWIAENFDAEFFVRHNLATDCADVAYSLRWIFARINFLPAAGTLAATSAVITQDDGAAAWANLPTHADWSQDQRFRAALKWLLNNVYTRTLWKDGYPLQIRRESIRPGTIHLLGGHTLVLSRMVDNGLDVPVTFLSSTVPQAVRSLSTTAFLDATPITEEAGGLLQFRWPVKTATGWRLTPKEEMADYSREQYAFNEWCDGNHFAMCVYRRMNLSFEPKRAVQGMIDTLNELWRSRTEIVRDGTAACASMDCTPGSVGYEDWSTPSRDKRLLENFQQSTNLASTLGQLDPAAQTLWNNWITEVSAPTTIARHKFFEYMENKLVSYDPRDSVASRWAAGGLAIEATVKRRWDGFAVQRQQKVREAQSCRDDRARCGVGSSEHTRLQTAELDAEMRETAKHYGNHCTRNDCPPLLLGQMKKVWFMKSQPWAPLNERTGETEAAQQAHVFYGASTMSETNLGTLVIDGNKLFDPASGTSTPVTAATYAVTGGGELLRVLQSEGVAIFRGGAFEPLHTPSGAVSWYGINLVNDTVVAITVNFDDRNEVLFLDISTGRVLAQAEGSASGNVTEAHVLLQHPEGNRILDWSDNTQTPVPALSENTWNAGVVSKVAQNHYILQGQDYRQNTVYTVTWELKNGALNELNRQVGYQNRLMLGDSSWYSLAGEVYEWPAGAAQARWIGKGELEPIAPGMLKYGTGRGTHVLSLVGGQIQGFKPDIKSDSFAVLGQREQVLSYYDGGRFFSVDQQGRSTDLGTDSGVVDCSRGHFVNLCASRSSVRVEKLSDELLEATVAGIPFKFPSSGFMAPGQVSTGTVVRPMEGVLIYRAR